MNYIWCILSIFLTPIIIGLIDGADRIITARMQGRVGPPLLQPFYDVFKLFTKQELVVNRYHNDFVLSSLLFTIVSVALFFAGQNLLIVVFAMIVGNIFLVLGAYSSNSPYCMMGAERELLQMLAAEPMILLAAVGFFMMTGSFDVGSIVTTKKHLILYLPGVFVALTYVLTIKLRKSPFDLSTSHHAHQELVKGLTTEFAGPSLAYFEMIHWYETMVLLAMLFLFFANIPIIGVIAVLFLYFLEILIDNNNTRVIWELMLGSTWIVTLMIRVHLILVLYMFR